MLAYFQGVQTPSYLLTVTNLDASDLVVSPGDFDFTLLVGGDVAVLTPLRFYDRESGNRDTPVSIKPGKTSEIIVGVRGYDGLSVHYRIMGNLGTVVVPVYQPYPQALPTQTSC